MGEIKKISSFIILEALLCNISNASKSLGCMCREEIEKLKEESLFIFNRSDKQNGEFNKTLT